MRLEVVPEVFARICKLLTHNEIFPIVANNLSKTRIDALGDRLRRGRPTQDDLVLLDEFRVSFGPAYDYVVEKLKEMKLAPTGRPEKSTPSVMAKLMRETTRLSQMQDIAGCRILVDDLMQQDNIRDAVEAVFRGCIVFDRRWKVGRVLSRPYCRYRSA